jgi:hypothetical protein
MVDDRYCYAVGVSAAHDLLHFGINGGGLGDGLSDCFAQSSRYHLFSI